MNRSKTTASALRLSVLCVVAGTVCGLAGQVVAQSAPVPAERAAAEAREQAQQIVREMRKELARESDDDGQAHVRMHVQGGDDEDNQVTVLRRRVQGGQGEAPRNKVERRASGFGVQGMGQPEKRAGVQVLPREGGEMKRRIELRQMDGDHGAGHPQVCPECGHVFGGGDEDHVVKLRKLEGMEGLEGLKGLQGMKIEGLEGLKGLQGMKVEGLEGLKGLQGMKMKIEGLEGLKQLHELEGMGDLHGKLMKLHELGDMEELHNHLTQLHGGGAGQHGEGEVRGKVIVIGPDGQRREFDLGDQGAGDAKARKQKVERQQIEKQEKQKVEKQKIEKKQKGSSGGTFFKAFPGEGAFVVPHGMGGGEGQGKVIIITPDGQTREFNFGGEYEPRGEGHFELFDGSGEAAHPFWSGWSVDPFGGQGRTVKAVLVRGNAV